LVTKEVRRKKAADADALQKAQEIAKKIDVHAETLLKKSTVEDVHQLKMLIR
jgi:hypothetical protein